MIFKETLHRQSLLREAITSAYRADEQTVVEQLVKLAKLTPDADLRVLKSAEKLVNLVKANTENQNSLDAILEKYNLSSTEGIALMCIAEALLRIPDRETVDKLLQDKITSVDWFAQLGASKSLFANAITFSLMLTGKLYASSEVGEKKLNTVLKNLAKKSSGVAIRPAIKNFMKFLGRKFVMGQTIEEALKRAVKTENRGYRYSYDMLGEAARTMSDANRYFDSYAQAIMKIGLVTGGLGPIQSPGISIKLSALHPRYEFAKKERLLRELVPRVKELALPSKKYDINLTIDAEEAERLEISLDIIEAVFSDPALHPWEGFGLAVQSYQKRAIFVLDWLADLARRYQRKIMVRLIKGAYWDFEIKNSQELGVENYPVFTRKHATDVSFIACAKKIIHDSDAFFPQFATHNAQSIAVILELIGNKPFEFQCLYGMGQKLYDHIVGSNNKNVFCRVYAPVGSYEDLLGYLMRRLLENGANTSFVHLMANPETATEKLVLDPVNYIEKNANKPHPHIPLPRDVFSPQRKNSRGIDLNDSKQLSALQRAMNQYSSVQWKAQPLINGKLKDGKAQTVVSPTDGAIVGHVIEASPDDIENALTIASNAFLRWSRVDVVERANCLLKAADLLEERMPLLMTMACLEAGKTLSDCVSEVREAIDFCRYYAGLAQEKCRVQILQGLTGERNQLFLQGLGVVASISPWNFPLAIFMGQVTAALVTGNAVIAKPAEQTPLIAMEAVRLLHEAGIPVDVLQLLPGRGDNVGARVVADRRVTGVMFTGSTETAVLINQSLAKRGGPIAPFIAETGGQNAMIVDSTALPEQVVSDVIRSAFGSAGQRCSALRVLYLQEEVADKIITMLTGAMAELSLGDPRLLSTDVGPVIDAKALALLQKHFDRMSREARLIFQTPLPAACKQGHFFAPCVFEINAISQLTREVFGPFLHVVRFKIQHLGLIIDDINNTGYGLTLGIHTRIESTANTIFSKVNAGNTYVNRNMIGAVVGAQPFGGMGLSGTGPKAGGPHYLSRLCTERTLCVNTTAAGGNTSLLTLSEGDEL